MELGAQVGVGLTAAGLVGAALAFALGLPIVSHLLRIMLYAASLLAWLFAVPAQAGPLAGSFALLVGIVLGTYVLLRILFRVARTAFWVLAVFWCATALFELFGRPGVRF